MPDRFFSYSVRRDFETHETLFDAVESAETQLDHDRENAEEDGWSDEAEFTCYGLIIGDVRAKDRTTVTEYEAKGDTETAQQMREDGHTETVDFRMLADGPWTKAEAVIEAARAVVHGFISPADAKMLALKATLDAYDAAEE